MATVEGWTFSISLFPTAFPPSAVIRVRTGVGSNVGTGSVVISPKIEYFAQGPVVPELQPPGSLTILENHGSPFQ